MNVNDRRQGWLASLLLIPILIAAAVVGAFVLVVVLGLVLFAAAVLIARVWWLRRTTVTEASFTTAEVPETQEQFSGRPPWTAEVPETQEQFSGKMRKAGASQPSQVLEGEYVVIREPAPRQEPPRR